jgi:hypothetical protein
LLLFFVPTKDDSPNRVVQTEVNDLARSFVNCISHPPASFFRNSLKFLRPKPLRLVSLKPSHLLVVPLVKGFDFASVNDEAMP